MAKRGLGSAALPWIQAAPIKRDTKAKSEVDETPTVELQSLPVSKIKRSPQLKLRADPLPDIDLLAKDIEKRGQTTALFVRPKGSNFELISGYRRMAALEKVGQKQALVRIFEDLSDDEAFDLAVSENQARESLTELERALVCQRLQSEGKTGKEIAERFGWRDERQAFNYLKVAKECPKAAKKALQSRQLSFSIALELTQRKTEDVFSAKELELLVAKIIKDKWSVRQVVQYLKDAVAEEPNKKGRAGKVKKPYAYAPRQDGGFDLRMRFKPDDDSIDEMIDTLKSALETLRKEKRKSAQKSKPKKR